MEQNDFRLDVVSVRLVKTDSFFSEEKIINPESAIKVMGDVFKELDREVVGVINLKSDGTPINCHIASMGSLNYSLVEPREMLKASILSNACNMIMMHNHPSGKLFPSKEDITITDRMSRVCSLIGIPLLDHVIVGGDNKTYFSFREKGMVNFNETVSYAEDLNEIRFGSVAERSGKDEIHGRGTYDSKKR